MQLTDDHGQPIQRPAGARPITDDGRLLWLGPVLPHQFGEFLLDGVPLRASSVDEALAAHSTTV